MARDRPPQRSHHDEDAAEISGLFTTIGSGPASPPPRAQITAPPPWLMGPAEAVLKDLQAPAPIAGLRIVASPIVDLNGLTLGVAEPPLTGEVVELPDQLDPNEPTVYGGGNWVPRSLTTADLLVLVADLLQEDLAETSVAWGQARPPCPHHPHPAQPAIHACEAWWICPHDHEPLYRIGRDEVPG